MRTRRGRVLGVARGFISSGKRESPVISDIYIDLLRKAVTFGDNRPPPYFAAGITGRRVRRVGWSSG
jgi:hypothetical protein